MKKITISMLVMIFAQCNALSLQKFTSHKAKTTDNKIAVMDDSEFSIRWLSLNYSYLIENKIPVLLLNTDKDFALSLITEYPNLIAGNIPPPKELSEHLFNKIGIKYYPSVAEGDVIWQVKPPEKK